MAYREVSQGVPVRCSCGHPAVDHDRVETMIVTTSERRGEISRTVSAVSYPCTAPRCICREMDPR